MKQSAFDIGEHLKVRDVTYLLSSVLWEKWDLGIDLNFNKWTCIKYLDDNGDKLNQDISQVPNDSGGLYLFFVKCNTIAGITEFPFYIGRAQYTVHQNLRKRVREYFTKYRKEDERPKITRMFKYWSNELYLAFIKLDEQEDVIDFEAKIINSLLLPMNEKVPDKEISQAVKAFNI